jgi:hypothetical protein
MDMSTDVAEEYIHLQNPQKLNSVSPPKKPNIANPIPRLVSISLRHLERMRQSYARVWTPPLKSSKCSWQMLMQR